MKKLASIMTVVLLVSLSLNVYAGVDLIYAPVPFTLSTTGDPVAITTGAQPCYGFTVLLSDDTGWYLYLTSDGSDTPTTISDNVAGVSWDHLVLPGTTVFYAKAISGTPKLYLFPAKKRNY